MVPSLVMLLQEFGRGNHILNATRGKHGYSVYLNVNTFLILLGRYLREQVAAVSERHVRELLKALTVLVLPKECYHTAFAREFENPATFDKSGLGCPRLCPFCSQAYKLFTGPIHKQPLIAALISNVFNRGSVTGNEFVRFLNDEKHSNKLRKKVWGNQARVSSGQVHALVLQLFAAGFVEAYLENGLGSRRSNIRLKDIHIRLTTSTIVSDSELCEDYVIVDAIDDFTLRDDSKWDGFQLY